MASSFTIKLQLRVCQYHLMLYHFSFRLPVCSTHKLVDILWPRRGRGLIELSMGHILSMLNLVSPQITLG